MKKIKGKNGRTIAILENDNCICRWIEESGTLAHDRNMLPLVVKHINKGDVVIDAGAFVGDHVDEYAMAVGIKGHVYAYEPNKESFECLAFNQNGRMNVTCINKGLGSKPEFKGIAEVEGNIGMNHLIEGNSIEIVTLDSMSLDRVNFIKIDVEGYELEILKGATETIKKFKPKMLIEINQMALERMNLKRENIFQFLDEHGYTYANIYPNQSINEYQLDILCLPK